MIDNGGVVIRVTWNLYSSNVVMTEWVPLVPPPSAALVLTPASISEAGGVSTVTATLDRTTGAATTITVSAAAVAPAVAADFGLSSATTLTIPAGQTASTGTVTITANDNDVDAADKTVTVSGTAAGDVVEDPSDVTLTLEDDDTAESVDTRPALAFGVTQPALVFTVDKAIDPVTLPLKEGTGNPPITYALTPAELPPGLAFDKTSRTLSGTPTEAFGPKTYTWTARDADGDLDELTFTIAAESVDTRPALAFGVTQPALVFTVDKAIDPVTLPLVKEGTGDPPITYALTPAGLPRGLAFDKTSRTLSGTPTEAFGPKTYTWTATDGDGETVSLTFDIEVKPALAEARARLKRINESVLPELSRALWGSTLDAVTGRLESPDAAAPTAADGLETAAGFVRANESALEKGDVSWKELLGAESFAFGLAGDGEGGAGIGGAVAWGSGDWQTRSRYEDALDWSGGAFSAHAGVDAALRPDLRAGLAASWFSSDVDYTDRSQGEAIAGSHESRMMSLTPYLGWDVGDGTRLWGAAGYGWGKIEIVDADLRERFGAQKADSRFLAGAAGGSVPVWSRGPATLEAKGSAEATRWRVKDNGDAIAGVVVSTRRLRLAAVGSRAYALDGGATLTPSLELGGRWDGGDGATGAGLEGGAGLSWTDPARGLTVEAKGRALLAHHSNVEEEWGASGSMRLETDADGLGLSFGLRPSWGASGSGLARLWDEGVAARPAVGGGNEARLETELGYGLPAFGGAGVTTPYAGFGLAQGGERDLRAGVRLGLDAGFDLGIEAERRESAADTGHGIGLDLSIRW